MSIATPKSTHCNETGLIVSCLACITFLFLGGCTSSSHRIDASWNAGDASLVVIESGASHRLRLVSIEVRKDSSLLFHWLVAAVNESEARRVAIDMQRLQADVKCDCVVQVTPRVPQPRGHVWSRVAYIDQNQWVFTTILSNRINLSKCANVTFEFLDFPESIHFESLASNLSRSSE